MIKRGAAFLLVLILLSSLLPAALAEDYVDCRTTYSIAPKSSVWKTYKANLHYYYNQLTEKEKRAFSCRYDSIALGKPELWVLSGFDLSYRENDRVMYALVFDCPELMLGDTQYSKIQPDIDVYTFWATNSKKMIINNASSLIAHSKKISNWIKQSKAVLNKIKKRKDWGKTAFDHQLAYDRYIVNNCSYKLDIKNSNSKPNYNLRGAFSVFVTKKAVCEGYARSTMFAMRCFGIPCIYVYGWGGGEPHAWNMVKIGKYWFHYDPTWQDADSKNFFADWLPYFDVTDTLIKRSHTLNMEAKSKGFTFPSAKSNASDYYKKKGKYLGADWKKKLASLIASAKKNGKKAIGIRFSNVKYYNAAYSYITSRPPRNLWQELYNKHRSKGFNSNFITKKLKCYPYPKGLILYFSWK